MNGYCCERCSVRLPAVRRGAQPRFCERCCRDILDYADRERTRAPLCAVCQRRMVGMRQHAVTCGTTCRQYLSRLRRQRQRLEV